MFGDEYKRDVRPELTDRFEAVLREFIEYRDKYGGILLPNVVMAESAFEDALYRVGLRERPKPVPIIGYWAGQS